MRVTRNDRTGDVRKSWVLRVTVKGAAVRELGLGSFNDVSLAEARERARKARSLAREGIDPIAVRDAERSARHAEAVRSVTFQECAERYIAAHRPAWRNQKHSAQWCSTLKTYVYPVFGGLPVGAIDVGLVLKVIEPLWETKTETGSRIRQRIEAVLGWAKARGYRTGENPAQWRGHLDKLLPPRQKVQKVRHHAAMPYAEVPSFMAALAVGSQSTSAAALAVLIMTASRTSELLNATWKEVDLQNRVWTIPGEPPKLYERSHAQVAPHIPTDNDKGRWQNTLIRVGAGT